MTIGPSANPIIRKLESIITLSDDEKAAVSSLPVQVTEISRGQDVVREGDRPTRSFALLSGFTCNFKVTGTGNRQIAAFHIPGDMPDLQSLHLPVLDFSIATLSLCKVAFIQHEALNNLCEQHSRIGRVLWREALVEASVGREWTMNIGQRPGASRIAHVLCELLTRMRAVGLAEGSSCAFPMTQADLGDVTGISPVHVNRCLQELRAAALIKLDDGKLDVLDWERLKAKADFEAAYLHLGRQDKAA